MIVEKLAVDELGQLARCRQLSDPGPPVKVHDHRPIICAHVAKIKVVQGIPFGTPDKSKARRVSPAGFEFG
jgi:hypothetical protein